MKIAGIIAEYNPFHRGHEFHILRTRERGATHVAVVMSGSMVQRGDIAVLDAYTRAEAAIKGGADLVLELAPQYSMSAARDFAGAGVGIFRRMGCIDMLSFGAETEDPDSLKAALSKITGHELEIKALMSSGLTYPQAAAKAVPHAAGIICGANNTLALEYLRALEGSGITPVAVKRTVPHDADAPSCGFASASAIRKLWSEGKSAADFTAMSPNTCELSFIAGAEKALLYRLSMMSESDFQRIRGCRELCGRLYSKSRRAGSLEEIYSAVKSRNFTHSRVRRAVLSAALGITAEDCSPPPFARVLALNERGAEILRVCRKTSEIPIGSSLRALSKASPRAERTAELTELASRLQGLCRSEEGISEYRKSAKMIYKP